MKKCFVCLAITVFCCVVTIPAVDAVLQTKPKESSEDPEIKIKTELMNVRVVVTDRKGQIIENLKKEDFELFENDRPQEISFFSISQVESKQEQTEATKTKATDKETLRLSTHDLLSNPPVRATLLFVDNLNLSFTSLNWVKESLRRFIKEKMTDQDVIALAASGQTLGLVQQFTRDRQLLNYGIEQIRLGPFRRSDLFTSTLAAGIINDRIDAVRQGVDIIRQEENTECGCQFLRSRARMKALQMLSELTYSRKATLSTLKDFAEQMIRLPGKRMIVIFSDGFTMHNNQGDVYYGDLQPAINRAVRSGVVIYAIDAKGVRPPPTIDASRSMGRTNPAARDRSEIEREAGNPAQSEEVRALLTQMTTACTEAPYCPEDSDWCNPSCFVPSPGDWTTFASLSEREEMNAMFSLADQTGGKLYNDTNNLTDALGRAFDANRYYYVLSYHLQSDINDTRLLSWKVRVRNHPEYTVNAAKGFSPIDIKAKEDEAAKTPQQRLIQAMRAPLPVTDLQVSAQADFVVTEADDKQVSLTAYVEGGQFQYREKDERNAFELEILYAIYDTNGEQVGEGLSAQVEGQLSQERLKQAKTSGYRFSQRLTLNPGVYEVHIGVRENGTDLMGTATAWIEVPKLAPDKLEMSSLIFRNPFDTDSLAAEGMNVSKLEQIKVVQGIPLFARNDFCDYSFRLYGGMQNPTDSDFVLLKELFHDGKPIKQEEWQPIYVEKDDLDGKGWFDVDGDVELSGLDPGVYELRISVKETKSNKIVQRAAVFGIE